MRDFSRPSFINLDAHQVILQGEDAVQYIRRKLKEHTNELAKTKKKGGSRTRGTGGYKGLGRSTDLADPSEPPDTGDVPDTS